ncbi:hypothetical protein JCM19237_5927 [Photobacterium aphoticum]|uniref:Uncharacterized protein n=1 Tax=Photobacterium aphoticum TaxID=754436 RepID=A0A090QML9_9GAMM|nr:hypothetical protein JCM19237_5927 [Photobacterium aphoticum]
MLKIQWFHFFIAHLPVLDKMLTGLSKLTGTKASMSIV